MSDSLALLSSLGSVEAWNDWRREHPEERPDFNRLSLYGLFSDFDTPSMVKGARAQLAGIDLRGASLRGCFLEFADLAGADLTGADLEAAILTDAVLDGARLDQANLRDTNLRRASLRGASLGDANLMYAQFNGADLAGANLENTNIYGISAWNVRVDATTRQHSLRIANYGDPTVTVDDLEVAQFVYLLFNYRKIRTVIDAVTSKVVLILGRFTAERKRVLDAVRDELRRFDLVPVVFDFEPAANQDVTDTVTLLARMARFIIADITDPRSVQQELTLIAPAVVVAIQPIILSGQEPWAMFPDLRRRAHWLLPVYEYRDLPDLLTHLKPHVVDRAEAKRRDLASGSPV